MPDLRKDPIVGRWVIIAKSRAKRPQTARDLSLMLNRVAQAWTLNDAEEWWSRHERGQQPVTGGISTPNGGNNATGSSSSIRATDNPIPTKTKATVTDHFDRTIDFDGSDDTDN